MSYLYFDLYQWLVVCYKILKNIKIIKYNIMCFHSTDIKLHWIHEKKTSDKYVI